MLILALWQVLQLNLELLFLKIVQSEVLIKLVSVPASDINIVFLGEKPAEGVTSITLSSGHQI